MERRCKEKKTSEPYHLFQIKLSNESAGRREVDCPFWCLRDLPGGYFWCQKQKLTVFPECYKLPEQTSIPLEKKPTCTRRYPFCHFGTPSVHLLLVWYRHPWHHLSSGYKATLVQLKTIVSSLNLSVEFWTGFTHSKKLLIFSSPPFFITWLFLFFTNCVSIHSCSWVVFHYSDA